MCKRIQEPTYPEAYSIVVESCLLTGSPGVLRSGSLSRTSLRGYWMLFWARALFVSKLVSEMSW
jgi:hypothetical protein